MHNLNIDRLTHAKKEMGKCNLAFKSAVEPLPFMLRTLGLGTTITILNAKDNEHTRLSKILAKWIIEGCTYIDPHWNKSADDNRDLHSILLDKIRGSDRGQYRQASIEAMAYASSLKRLAQAFCEDEDKSKESSEVEAAS